MALLAALLLPAVQSSREAARRLDCQNRHKQAALAVHNFHQAHGHLPGPVYHRSDPPAFPRMLSEWARLLPFLDQSMLYQQIDDDISETGFGTYPDRPTLERPGNLKLLKTALTVVMCPSDSPPPGACNLRVCRGTMPLVGRVYTPEQDKGRRGVFPSHPLDHPPGFHEVSDGLSNTMMISERLVGDFDPERFSPHRDTYYLTDGRYWLDLRSPDDLVQACQTNYTEPLRGEYSYGGATWLLAGETFTAYCHVAPPNSKTLDCVNNGGPPLAQATATARSWHAQGVNGAFADGSVRFVSEAIDTQVWRALGTRAGNEAGVEF
jgi:prepilin-type processing-associated H-X9-DG protein